MIKRKIHLPIMITILCILVFSSCDKGSNDIDNRTSSIAISSNTNTKNGNNDNLKTDSPIETIPSNNNTQKPGIEGNEPKETSNTEPSSIPGFHTEKISAKEDYSDAYRLVKVLGLKEYKKLTDGNYTDKAKKGKKFLVLFLSIRNDSSEDDYINYNYISAKIDGKKIEHTFLVNEPKGYPTIFTHVPTGKSIGGFIVWEVPSSWKKLEFVYNGWKDINNVSIKADFTPEDLSDPIVYNANDFS